MANRNRREALRGAEVNTFDLIFDLLTPTQWALWLKAPLERAAAQGKRDLAQRLVGAGAGLGDALHMAVRRGHGEIANDLLKSGASIASKDFYGHTPLHIAACYGQMEMVQLLLLKGAEKDTFDDKNFSPLYLAAYGGHLAAALALLAAGADVNLRCGPSNEPVIHMAAEKGQVEICRALIEHGADVDVISYRHHRDTALFKAALCNNAEVIDVLVEGGANIEARDRDGWTPLHAAAIKRSRDALLSLLKHGAAVNAQTDSFTTPLMIAATYAGAQGASEAVDSLLRAGADETIVDKFVKKASDVIGRRIHAVDLPAEDVERVRELLANAPADRAWRRRGYLVLCRAHPDRLQQSQAINNTHHASTAPRAGSRAKLARASGVEGGGAGDESTAGDWAVVVATLLRLREEGIFRTIVEYI